MNTQLFIKQIQEKQASIGVIGLGYVGLPIALEFAKQFKVVGFDINQERVDLMKKGIDPSKELEAEAFQGVSIEFTAKAEDLSDCSFIIVAVPTPVDRHNVPNLGPVLSASRTVGSILKPGSIVVFESTVYPGCTEEDCKPVLEEVSGLRHGKDFFLGYSPERINPGDKHHTLTKITKVVSGCCDYSSEIIAALYGAIIEAGVFQASNIKVAEAAKVIENTQRDLNIALMNELSKIFDKVGINTYDVLEAAGTKWNFLKFSPGLVGGHCIGVDPYYLTYKANELGYEPEVILAGRRINDDMSAYVAKKCIQLINKSGNTFNTPKVALLGITFKENVADIRNSKVADLAKELIEFGVDLTIHDPHADPHEVELEYNLTIAKEIGNGYDAIILAVPHTEFIQKNSSYWKSIGKSEQVIFLDLKGTYSQSEFNHYWSL